MTTLADRLVEVDVCALDRLTPDLGVAALVGDRQVAIVRVEEEVFAVDNLCPFSGAAVISRGITGSRGDEPTIASPIYKQVFSLRDGRCLDAVGMEPRPGFAADLAVYGVRIVDGRVLLELPEAGMADG